MSVPPEGTPTGDANAADSAAPLTRRELRERARRAEAEARDATSPSAPDPAPPVESASEPHVPIGRDRQPNRQEDRGFDMPDAPVSDAGAGAGNADNVDGPGISGIPASEPAPDNRGRLGDDPALDDAGRVGNIQQADRAEAPDRARINPDHRPAAGSGSPPESSSTAGHSAAAESMTQMLPPAGGEHQGEASGFEALGLGRSEHDGDEQEQPVAGATERKPKPRRRVSVVGVIGELLLTAGVLVMLFLAWQLWLNDIVVRGEQNSAAQDLADQWAAGVEPTEPSEDADYGDPVILGQPGEAEEFAILRVPRFGEDYAQTIAGGTSAAKVLNPIGLGHYDDTQMPGENGNFAIAGHRNTHGAPLNRIAELQVGDAIVVQTKDGYYTYRFRTMEYVQPTAVEVLNPVPQSDTIETTDGLITLTSCNPMFSTAERIIAYGVFESWVPLSAGELPVALTEGVS